MYGSLFGNDNAREQLIIDRRKDVKPGDSSLEKGAIFTHSFNKGCGDRSYMNCIWKVMEVTPQQVVAECIMDIENEEGGYFKRVGNTHMFDRGEYEFYEAGHLYDSVTERRNANKAVSIEDSDPLASLGKDQLMDATVKAYFA